MKLSYINEAFEPGSVFKMLTVASALENKTARPNTKYFCENGSFRVADHIISEAEASHSFDWLTVTEILQNSSNIGTTKIAFDLTYPRFKKSPFKLSILAIKPELKFPVNREGFLQIKKMSLL